MPFFPQFSSLFVPPFVPAVAIAPNEISNLEVWYKADAGVTYDGSDLVTEWADQSGNEFNLTPESGYEPEYIPNYVNGLPAIYFSGTKYISNADYTNSQEYTFFNVVKFISGNRVFTSINTNVLIGSYNNASDVMYSGSNWVYLGNSASTDWKLNMAKSETGFSSFSQNGTELGTDNSFSQLDAISVGGNPTWENGNGTAECYHAELCIYGRILTSAEISGLELYFNNKYAIY